MPGGDVTSARLSAHVRSLITERSRALSESTDKTKTITYLGAVAIGIGGMVGGGIFAVLGLAAELGGGGTPVAFAIAGLVALLSAYSYAKLSVAYPSRGGTVAFLNRAYGSGLLTGSLNVLLWLSYIVMLSLYSSAFGSYGAAFLPEALQPAGKHALTSFAILAVAALNILSANIVSRAESYIVGLKLAILLFFVVVGLRGVDVQRVRPEAWESPLSLLAGGMIIFLAYEGFELIANTAQDIRDPSRTLPRAYYSAVGFVIVLYVLVALVAIGNLPVDEIVAAKDYALAAAARPFLGSFGFGLIAVAALLSTASAINATLYGVARFSYIIAKDGQLPAVLEREVWRKPLVGLFITAGATLVVANLLDVSSISTMGSSGFLIIFGAVNGANVRLAASTGSRRWISAAGVAACGLALLALLWQTATTSPARLLVLGLLVGLALAIEYGYRAVFRRGEIRVDADGG